MSATTGCGVEVTLGAQADTFERSAGHEVEARVACAEPPQRAPDQAP